MKHAARAAYRGRPSHTIYARMTSTWLFRSDDRSVPDHRSPADGAAPSACGFDRKDAARALCAAGEAVAGRACRAPRWPRRSARVGVPAAQRKMRVQQIWHWLYVRGAQRLRRHDQRVEGAARGARPAFHAGAAGSRRRAGLGRRHPQVAAAAAGRACRRAARTRSSASTFPEADRGTLCLSSQVGCTLTCSFCHTGTQRLVRNLTPGEIVGQIMVARDRLGDWHGVARRGPMAPDAARLVSNIVMMGMGEPLYNFEAVRDALAGRRRRRRA